MGAMTAIERRQNATVPEYSAPMRRPTDSTSVKKVPGSFSQESVRLPHSLHRPWQRRRFHRKSSPQQEQRPATMQAGQLSSPVEVGGAAKE